VVQSRAFDGPASALAGLFPSGSPPDPNPLAETAVAAPWAPVFAVTVHLRLMLKNNMDFQLFKGEDEAALLARLQTWLDEYA
jgi:hypothetical protein